MPQFTLQQLAEITKGKLHGNKGQLIGNLETDSRNIILSEQSIFIAIKGSRHDGHLHIAELISRGIRNFMVERETPELIQSDQVNYLLIDDCIKGLQQIAAHYRHQLTMPVIAVTGSNGKTVVKEWLAHCLSGKGSVSRSPKSFNSQIGVPLSLWMIQPSSDWAIIEAGISMPGEMEKLESIVSPEFGIITNIGPAHQENFNNLDQKTKEKLILFRNSKTVYYCRDHQLIHQYLSSSENSFSTISWSEKHPESFLYIREKSKSRGITTMTIVCDGRTDKLAVPFTDDASLENCLHIAAFMLHQGFTHQDLQESLGSLVPVAMRLEQVKGVNNCTLINDSYNSDLYSLRIALDYLAMQKQHAGHSLILSDIRQSGLSADILNTEVEKMLKAFHFDNLIFVGEELSKSKIFSGSASYFRTTDELIQNLNGIRFSDQAILIKGAREFGFERIVHALSEKKHTTLLEINLDHLVHNLNYFRGLLKPGTRIMVMVKALSYGSGGSEIANLLQHQKVDYLGVAFTDEGVELRKAGIGLPVMVMAPSEESYDEIIEYNLEPEIYSFSGLQNFSRMVAAKQLPSWPVHIKLDTGMHRLGFLPDDIRRLTDTLLKLNNIRVKALFSHLAVSDNKEEDAFTNGQINLFEEQHKYISGKLGYQPWRHILNSAGIERFPEAHFEMVRLGIGLYGISSRSADLKPVSTLKTRICQIKKIPSSDTVGYNRRGILDRDSEIAIIPIGYADGLDRKLGNRKGQVVVKNKLVPFIGDICMDLSMIDVTGINAREGDEVIIFGEEHTIRQLASQVGTIPYEILTNVSSRVKRVYING
jgi:Alr-MurF fusion protein